VIYSHVPRLRLAELLSRDEVFHFAELRPGGPASLVHRHDFLEFFWVTRGSGSEVLGPPDTPSRRPLAVGDYALVAADDTHHFENDGRMRLANVAFSPRAWAALARRHPGLDADTFAGPADRRRGRLTADGAAALGAAAALVRTADRSPARLELLLLTLWAALGDTPPAGRPVPAWLRSALDSDAAMHGGVAGLVAACGGYGREYVARTCRRCLDRTPTELVRERRLREAVRRLEQTDDGVLEVGLASGFGNAGHFHQTFKAHFGVTPRRYRARGRAVAPARDTP